MNILPFVTMSLILLATLSYNSLDKGKLLRYEKETALGYMRAEKILLNKMHKAAFNKAPTKKETSDLSQKTIKKETHPSPLIRGFSLVKMNLSPLFKEDCPEVVKITFFNLLKTYYGHSSFLEPSTLDFTIKNFINHFIESGKEKIHQYKEAKKDLFSIKLSQFHPKSTLENHIFYKMLKGTHQYNLEKQEGYPPFEDVFCLEEKKPLKILHFPSLPSTMLKALFGEPLTKSILEKEAAIPSNGTAPVVKILSEQELLDLLHKKSPSDTKLDPLIAILDFSLRHKLKEKIIVCDETTNIHLEKELPAR